MPQRPESFLNPERMSRGITRDDFKKLQLAAEGDGEESNIEDELAFAEAQVAGTVANANGKD